MISDLGMSIYENDAITGNFSTQLAIKRSVTDLCGFLYLILSIRS